MSTVADDVLARIQAVESQRSPIIELSGAEIAALGAAFFPGVKIADIRQCGVVRIVNRDDPSTRIMDEPLPVKPVNPKDDLSRHRFACDIARRRGEPEPPMPVAAPKPVKRTSKAPRFKRRRSMVKKYITQTVKCKTKDAIYLVAAPKRKLHAKTGKRS